MLNPATPLLTLMRVAARRGAAGFPFTPPPPEPPCQTKPLPFNPPCPADRGDSGGSPTPRRPTGSTTPTATASSRSPTWSSWTPSATTSMATGIQTPTLKPTPPRFPTLRQERSATRTATATSWPARWTSIKPTATPPAQSTPSGPPATAGAPLP